MSGTYLRYILLLVGSYATLVEMIFWEEGLRGEAASLIGQFFLMVSPEILSSKILYWASAIAYHFAGLFWILSPQKRIGSCFLAISFLVCSSLYIENLVLAQTHLFQPLAYTFIILAFKDIGIIRNCRYLIISFLSFTFFHSGVQKLLSEGQWWDSANLQTIFHYFGQNSMINEIVLNNSMAAQSVGIVVLIFELSCLVPVLWPRLFPFWGITQLLFLIFVAISFHWVFYPMMILIAAYLWNDEKKGLAYAS